MTRNPTLAKALIFTAVVLALSGPASHSTETILVRMESASLTLLPPELRQGIRAVAPLTTAFLAVVPSDLAFRLAETGAGIEILDSSPGGKAYFLVRLDGPGDWPDLNRSGRTIRLDGRTALFWSGNREAREILPPRFEIARVFLDVSVPLAALEAPAVLAPAAPWPVPAADPVISQLAAQVSKSRLTTLIGDLENFQTRYTSTTACESAGTYLHNSFSGLGLPVEYDPFSFSNNRYATRNIVATLRGRTAPDREVIVCGHYDSTSNQASSRAPGADDNGSGTAAVVEIARVLAGTAFDFTIKFICFSAEEWGLYGSKHYAQEAQAAGAKIIGVINMDMIAFPDRWPWQMDVVRNSASAGLADRFVAAAAEYAGLTAKIVAVSSWPYSDHSPFWNAGYSALCAIENESPTSPYYHKTTDTLGTLTMDYALLITRAALATAAGLAQPVSSPSSPSGLVVRSQINRSLFARVKTVGLRWDANRDAVVGYYVHRATVRGGPYERITPALLATTEFTDRFLDAAVTYYYVVMARDGQGRESGLSVEVADSEATWK
jgi:hypothetical protein